MNRGDRHAKLLGDLGSCMDDGELVIIPGSSIPIWQAILLAYAVRHRDTLRIASYNFPGPFAPPSQRSYQLHERPDGTSVTWARCCLPSQSSSCITPTLTMPRMPRYRPKSAATLWRTTAAFTGRNAIRPSRWSSFHHRSDARIPLIAYDQPLRRDWRSMRQGWS
jgi:hypothetical protein